MKRLEYVGFKLNKTRDYHTPFEMYLRCEMHNQIPVRQQISWEQIGVKFVEINRTIRGTTWITQPSYRYNEPIFRQAII